MINNANAHNNPDPAPLLALNARLIQERSECPMDTPASSARTSPDNASEKFLSSVQSQPLEPMTATTRDTRYNSSTGF